MPERTIDVSIKRIDLDMTQIHRRVKEIKRYVGEYPATALEVYKKFAVVDKHCSYLTPPQCWMFQIEPHPLGTRIVMTSPCPATMVNHTWSYLRNAHRVRRQYPVGDRGSIIVADDTIYMEKDINAGCRLLRVLGLEPGHGWDTPGLHIPWDFKHGYSYGFTRSGCPPQHRFLDLRLYSGVYTWMCHPHDLVGTQSLYASNHWRSFDNPWKITQSLQQLGKDVQIAWLRADREGVRKCKAFGPKDQVEADHLSLLLGREVRVGHAIGGCLYNFREQVLDFLAPEKKEKYLAALEAEQSKDFRGGKLVFNITYN